VIGNKQCTKGEVKEVRGGNLGGKGGGAESFAMVRTSCTEGYSGQGSRGDLRGVQCTGGRRIVLGGKRGPHNNGNLGMTCDREKKKGGGGRGAESAE